jgi:hypothetical protein
MKFIMLLSVMGLLLISCVTLSGDASIRRGAVGLWMSDSQPGRVIDNRGDGTFVQTRYGTNAIRGTWNVRDGYIVGTFSPDRVESNKVISLSADTLVVLSIDGQRQLVWRKQ